MDIIPAEPHLRRREAFRRRELTMKKRVQLPPTVKRTSRLKSGKGWRLVNATRTGSLKGALVTTYNEAGERYAIFRLRD